MGGRGSKSKTQPNTTATLSRRGTFQTFVITVDPSNECVDEVTTPVHGEQIKLSEQDEKARDSAAKMSKVQEILEGKVELKKHSRMLEHLPQATTTAVTPLDLEFSSSEDSDDDTASNKKKRKTSKKKKKQKHGAATPSPAKRKLNDLKPLSKLGSPHKQPAENATEHFEQIKDAYSLAEYQSKDSDELRPDPPSPADLPRPKSKPLPSPGGSPTKFFASAFDHWRKPSITSAPSNRSQIMEQRDASRTSQARSNRSSASSKSERLRSVKHGGGGSSNHDDSDAELFDVDDVASSFSSSGGVRSQRSIKIEIKVAEERVPSKPNPIPHRPEKRTLRIDDTDESIMDDILAEVVT